MQVYGLATGIAATAPVELLAITGCLLRDNVAGLTVQGSVHAKIDASSFRGNVTSGVGAQGGAQVNVSNSVISGSVTGAAVAAASGASTQLTLTASQLSGNNIALGGAILTPLTAR